MTDGWIATFVRDAEADNKPEEAFGEGDGMEREEDVAEAVDGNEDDDPDALSRLAVRPGVSDAENE